MPSELAFGTSASSCSVLGQQRRDVPRRGSRTGRARRSWGGPTSALAMCGQPSTWVTRSRSISSSVAPGLELLLEDQAGADVHGSDQREAEPAHPEQRHGRVEHVVGAQVAHLAQVVGMADRPHRDRGSPPSARRCCPRSRRPPSGRTGAPRVSTSDQQLVVDRRRRARRGRPSAPHHVRGSASQVHTLRRYGCDGSMMCSCVLARRGPAPPARAGPGSRGRGGSPR